MCGISAIIRTSVCPPSDQDCVKNMLNAIKHRGPDDLNIIDCSSAILGHVRLSIVDIENGSQPMNDISSRYTIIFNGEIYNYIQLRNELLEIGCQFRTCSDTEVLLNAYLTWKEKVVHHIKGQYSFLIWDCAEKSFFAARDPFGEKPFYFSELKNGGIIVSSEIKGLLASGNITPKLDYSSLEFYLSLLYVPPDSSIYSNIYTLPPATYMTWSNGVYKTYRYLQDLFVPSTGMSNDDINEGIRYFFAKSVKNQMQCDVPFGALLSGGLDSATTVAEMSRISDIPIKTFNAYFDDDIDERAYAKDVSDMYDTEHYELNINIRIEDHLDSIIKLLDEPLADSSFIATYLISKMARQHVKVVLTGDGADELFGGYSWYESALDMMSPSTSTFNIVRWFFLKNVSKIGFFSKVDNEKIKREIKAYKKIKRYGNAYNSHIKNRSSNFVNGNKLGYVGSLNIEDKMRSNYQFIADLSPMDNITDFDCRVYLPGDILMKVDRASMSVGLESRSPFLDLDLFKFVLSIDWSKRFKKNNSKYLMRKAFNEYWPLSLRNRGKQGFGAPVEKWLHRREMKEFTTRVFNKQHVLATLFTNIEDVEKYCTPQECWTLLTLGLWLERHEGVIE